MNDSASSRPNVLVFFVDQQRWDTVGLQGYPAGLTPNFDRMARQGTYFPAAVTPQPVCGPARSCLQTGQYATTTGVWKNGPGLKPDAPKLAELFREAGYHTAYFGKWHLSGTEADGAVPSGCRGGYEHWLAANCVELVSGPYSARLWNEEDQPVPLHGYRVDAQTDPMLRYLEARAADGQPFLCVQSYLEPHHQNSSDTYPAPDGYEAQYRYAPRPPDLEALGGSAAAHWSGYCGMIKRLDEALGRTLDTLRSTGLDRNTVVVYLSDHGCHFKTRNAEYKRSPHESSVRIPLAIRGPGWDGGGEHAGAVSLVDVMPTLLDCAGIPIPPEVQGRSLRPFTRGGATDDWPEESLIQFGDGWLPPGRALRSSRWKYAVTAPETSAGTSHAPRYEETHLYDLQADPFELTNLVDLDAFASVRETLRERLLARMAEIGEAETEIIPSFAVCSSGQRRPADP